MSYAGVQSNLLWGARVQLLSYLIEIASNTPLNTDNLTLKNTQDTTHYM